MIHPLRPVPRPRERLALLRREGSSYRAFLRQQGPLAREIVFHAAQAHYIAVYEGLIAALGQAGSAPGYITADHDDPLLVHHPPHLAPVYFRRLFPLVLPFLRARVVVMTMPDLHRFHIRRSIFDTNHVYLFHSLMSTHMGFRPGALDHFDTILCASPHHVEEIRRTEALYGLKPKRLVEAGYYRLERIYRDHARYRAEAGVPVWQEPCVLVAPSGHAANISSTCAVELVGALLRAGYDVIFRPHPMTIYTRPQQVHRLLRQFGDHAGFQLDLETVSEASLHRAQLLITDWSGVALEYAFGTERPVLFIDLPRRQQNPEYHRVGIPAVEVYLRDRIGRVVRREEIPSIARIVLDLLGQKERWRETLAALRERYVYNFGHSSTVMAGAILKLARGEPVGVGPG